MNYKYENGLYTLENEMWSTINFAGYNDLFNKNHCAIGMMRITSDAEEDDSYSYISPITGEKVTESFSVCAGNFKFRWNNS